MPVELALTPDSRWEIDTGQLVEAAHQAGFTGLGLHALRANSEVAAAYAAAGMRCHELLALLLSDNEPATLSSAEKLAEAAALMGAEWVLTVFRTGLNRDTARLIERCAAVFAGAGTGRAVEFSPLLQRPGAVTPNDVFSMAPASTRRFIPVM